MSGALLTVDLGNTRCKLCLWDRSRTAAPLAWTALAVDERLVESAENWLRDQTPVAAGALCAVAARPLEEELAAALARALEGRWLSPIHGLAIDCEHPETIGADRLFAARGALDRVGRTCIVVDAGTALTVDLIRVESGRGHFAGGAIAPGPELLARALARGGARLPVVAPHPGVRALGRDTRSAIEAGVAIGFRGAARELVREISREAGDATLPIVVTGGAAAFLTTDDSVFEVAPILEPWLVHRGLLAALECALLR